MVPHFADEETKSPRGSPIQASITKYHWPGKTTETKLHFCASYSVLTGIKISQRFQIIFTHNLHHIILWDFIVNLFTTT